MGGGYPAMLKAAHRFWKLFFAHFFCETQQCDAVGAGMKVTPPWCSSAWVWCCDALHPLWNSWCW